jgi:hypothetical protein
MIVGQNHADLFSHAALPLSAQDTLRGTTAQRGPSIADPDSCGTTRVPV